MYLEFLARALLVGSALILGLNACGSKNTELKTQQELQQSHSNLDAVLKMRFDPNTNEYGDEITENQIPNGTYHLKNFRFFCERKKNEQHEALGIKASWKEESKSQEVRYGAKPNSIQNSSLSKIKIQVPTEMTKDDLGVTSNQLLTTSFQANENGGIEWIFSDSKVNFPIVGFTPSDPKEKPQMKAKDLTQKYFTHGSSLHVLIGTESHLQKELCALHYEFLSL